jgi:maltooligosyltrehalose trehalohydrolase
MRRVHDMPFGARVGPDGSVLFRLWAPAARGVEVVLEGGRLTLPMGRLADGWFELESSEAGPGARYRYRIDGDLWVPDPASRFQPEDVHGDSQVVDPGAFDWQDGGWRGRPWEEAVIYELHVGSFTPEGTFAGVEGHLDHLAALGVTAVELMPVADFPGAHDWGYDGVLPFAPDSRYGTPEDLKRLVQAAHARGLMVFLDVVYNHFGPEGNYLHAYAPPFFNPAHHTPWGPAINFDGPRCRTVRRFFVENALYWLTEYHLDGLRFDAVHAIVDESAPHILEDIAAAVRAGPGARRPIHLVLENDANQARYLARDDGRSRHYTAQWNDDIHHALHVLLTGEGDGYYQDYSDDPRRHLARCLTEGFAYQGAASPYRGGRPRGEPSRHLPPAAFVTFLQNHDQAGNRAFGERIAALAPAVAVRAATAVLLLAPAPPLLFMGQEWGASQPFPFFCDFEPNLAPAVTEGRRREFAAFPAFADPQARARIPDPCDPATFRAAVLDWSAAETPEGRGWIVFHRRLLALRGRMLAVLGPRPYARWQPLGTAGLMVTWRGAHGTATLLANLGEAPLDVVCSLHGQVLFATPEDAAASRRLPPWSAVWRLAEAA